MRLLTLLIASVVLVALGGCTESEPQIAEQTPVKTATPVAGAQLHTFDGETLSYTETLGQQKALQRSTVKAASMHLISTDINRLQAVPAPLGADVPVATATDRAIAAVEAMMTVEYREGEQYSSLWGRICGLGQGVKSVESLASEPVVSVTLTGAGGALCDVSMQGYALRSQQLAWTVVTNLGVDESTAVRVLDESGRRLLEDVIPDRAYLAVEQG